MKHVAEISCWGTARMALLVFAGLAIIFFLANHSRQSVSSSSESQTTAQVQ